MGEKNGGGVSDFQVFHLLRIILENSNFSRAVEALSGTEVSYISNTELI